MRQAEPSPRRSVPWGLLASLLLHALLVTVIILLPQPDPMTPLVENSIEVEIVSAPPAVPELRPSQVAPPARIPDVAPERPVPPAPKPQPPAMIRPTQLLSARTLGDPRSREAKATLAQLAPDDRIEQLCDVEAMDQVHAWKADFQPDRLIAYAMAETRLSGGALQADGAAFRSKRQWYKLKFKCAVSADLTKVASFEFLVGDPVPRSQWQSHNLPAVE